MDSHPHLPPGNKTRRKSSTESREIFAWRKYDNLLDRTPGDDLHHLPPTGPPPPPPGPPTHPPHPPHGPPEGMGIRGRSKSFSFPPGRHRSRESTNCFLGLFFYFQFYGSNRKAGLLLNIVFNFHFYTANCICFYTLNYAYLEVVIFNKFIS